MLTWMGYSIAVTLVFGVAAVLWEKAAAIGRWPARGGWIAAGILSVAVPIAQSLWPRPISSQILEIAAEPLRPAVWTAPLSTQAETAPAVAIAAVDERWFIGAWLLLSIGAATYFWSGYRAIRKEHRQSRRSEIAGHTVTLTKNLGPAVIGWRRPDIVMPEWIHELTVEQQALVVAHEQEHRRAHDVRLIGAGIITLIILPWNVALWWLFVRLRLAIEFDCDARVLRHHEDATLYGKVLLHASAISSARGYVTPALFESRANLERRIGNFLRARGKHDRLLLTTFVAGSLAIAAATANVEPPPKSTWLAGPANHEELRLASPQRQFNEQWSSIVQAVQFFEPGAIEAPAGMTAYVLFLVDATGRVASHRSEFRPSLQHNAISATTAQEMLGEHGAGPSATSPIFLQVRLRDSVRTPDVVILATDPGATAVDMSAPAIDLAAIRRDPSWLQASVLRRAQTERSILAAADPEALDAGVAPGDEVWIVLDAEGRYLNSGRRKAITDPNLSRSFVRSIDATYEAADVARGTSARDRSGRRVPITWHWLER